MGESLRSWSIKIIGFLALITFLVCVTIGPKEGAAFLGWVKGIGVDAVDSAKIFVAELKKQ